MFRFTTFFFLVGISAMAAVPNDANQVCPVKVGTRMPDAQVRDIKGQSTSLAALYSNSKKTLFVFYRGGWCPYCNEQLSGLKKIEDSLAKKGVQMVGLSADSPAELAKTLTKNKIKFKLYSDSTMTASRALGIAFRVDDETNAKYLKWGIDLEKASNEKHHELPVPTVLLVDDKGLIHFSYVNPNYKVRIKPELIIAAVDSM